jgi:hypothetical protein
LAADENTGFFLGLVNHNPGTFLLWTMRGHFYCGMTGFTVNVDNFPVRQANYRIRWESLLASACCGQKYRMVVQAL